MKIAVLAANGRSGKIFVDKAVAKGFKVAAGVHGNNPFSGNQAVKVVKCDATKKDQIKNLITGCDVVVSLIGHVKGSPADVQTVAINNTIQAMKEQGIKRLISLTGTGVRFSGDKVTFMDRFLNLGVSIADPDRVRDGKNHVEIIKTSGLDWTVIRVLKLQNVAPKPFKLELNGPTKLYVSREEVADAIIEAIEDNSFVGQSPIIAKA